MVNQVLSEYDKELLAEPSITTQLPVRINQAVFEEIVCICGGCGAELSSDHMFGKLNRYPTLIELRARSLCPHCTVVTAYLYRLHDNLSISTHIEGKTHRWAPQRIYKPGEDPKPWWLRAITWLFTFK